jgi:hypothetical protein
MAIARQYQGSNSKKKNNQEIILSNPTNEQPTKKPLSTRINFKEEKIRGITTDFSTSNQSHLAFF